MLNVANKCGFFYLKMFNLFQRSFFHSEFFTICKDVGSVFATLEKSCYFRRQETQKEKNQTERLNQNWVSSGSVTRNKLHVTNRQLNVRNLLNTRD